MTRNGTRNRNRIGSITAKMAARIRALIRQAERATASDEALHECASQVYIGDVYSLREDIAPARDDGWHGRCYVCDRGVPL